MWSAIIKAIDHQMDRNSKEDDRIAGIAKSNSRVNSNTGAGAGAGAAAGNSTASIKDIVNKFKEQKPAEQKPEEQKTVEAPQEEQIPQSELLPNSEEEDGSL